VTASRAVAGDRQLDPGLLDRVRRRLVASGETPTAGAVAAALRAEGGALRGDAELVPMLRLLQNEIVGAGPLEPFLGDPEVTDVLVNAPDSVISSEGFVSAAPTSPTTSSTATGRSSSAASDVTPASRMPHGTIRSYALKSGPALRAKPCSVTPPCTRTPIAAILRSGPRSSAGSHTPLRPATRPAPVTPRSCTTRISASSSRRTKSTTSSGSASATIG